MIMTYPTGGTITAVDCQKQVRSWRLLRSLMELLIPSCNCTSFLEENQYKQEKCIHNNYYCKQPSFTSTSCCTITGTIFGRRHGKVSFCIQTSPQSGEPILLLELAVPTAILAREMRGGILRIALECSALEHRCCSLLSVPIWNMYCNGRKVGFAVRRQASKADLEVLKRMESVTVGAGIINGKEIGCDHHHQLDDDIMYLRGKFQRVHGSCDAESFHLIDPDGNIDQELSVFFFRQR